LCSLLLAPSLGLCIVVLFDDEMLLAVMPFDTDGKGWISDSRTAQIVIILFFIIRLCFVAF